MFSFVCHNVSDILTVFDDFEQAIGYGFVAVTFAMQSLMKWACDRLEGWKRLAAADIFLTFSFIGTINVWRGLWQLLDLYVLFGK